MCVCVCVCVCLCVCVCACVCLYAAKLNLIIRDDTMTCDSMSLYNYMQKYYQTMPLEDIYYKRIGYILTLTVKTTFDWLNDVANVGPNALMTSANSDKTAFTFHFFDCLHALDSCNARCMIQSTLVISTSVISNNRLSREENPVLVLT